MTDKNNIQAISFFSYIFWGLTGCYLFFLLVTGNSNFWQVLMYGITFSVIVAFIFIAAKIKVKNKERVPDISNIKNNFKFVDIDLSKFENVLIRLFGAMGYIVEKLETEDGGGLILYKSKKKIFLKFDTNDSTDKNTLIKEIAEGNRKNDCSKGILVFISDVSKDSSRRAKEKNIELVDKEYLQELLLSYLDEKWK